MTPTVEIVANDDVMVAAALTQLRVALSESTGDARVALSGGHTPQPFYDAIAAEARAARLPLSQVEWIMGDERVVPHSHPRSNFAMIREHLLQPAEIAASRIHPMPVMLPDRRDAVASYEHTLQRLYGASVLDPARPLFDFILLGLGDDGHIASLFPGASSLHERERWVVATRAPDGEARLSLTLPALKSARHVVFLVEGATKRDALARWRADDKGVPAAWLNPRGSLLVLADAAAAGA